MIPDLLEVTYLVRESAKDRLMEPSAEERKGTR